MPGKGHEETRGSGKVLFLVLVASYVDLLCAIHSGFVYCLVNVRFFFKNKRPF